MRLDLAGAVPYDEAIGIIPAGNQQEGNGYLSCPNTLPMTDGQLNLRACTYTKGAMMKGGEVPVVLSGTGQALVHLLAPFEFIF